MKSTKNIIFVLLVLVSCLNEALAAFTDTEYSWYEKSIENLQTQ